MKATSLDRICRGGHLATAYALINAIKRIGDFDLILAGERHGWRHQVGPNIASGWIFPGQLTCSERARPEYKPSQLSGRWKASKPRNCPALPADSSQRNYPRLPTLRGKK